MTKEVCAAVGALWLCACTGSMEGGSLPTSNDSGAATATASGAGGGASNATGGTEGVTAGMAMPTTGGSPVEEPVTTDTIDNVADPYSLPDEVQATSQLPRLTHAQYQRALRNLLNLEVDVISEFPSEQPTLDGYYAPAELRVNERLYLDYQRVAEQLSERLVSTPDAYTEVVGCDPTATGCRDQFLQQFLLNAYRRPATASELERYGTLFDSGPDLVESADAFADGVRLVVQAVLQSPNFLYRVERGSAEPSSVVALTEYEKAARLSFMLTDAPPDSSLLDAAGAGRLSTPADLATEAGRLMALPAFVEKVRDFHDRWLQLEGLAGASKDSSIFPEFSRDLAESMREETLRFIEEATLNEGGAVTALLSAPYTFVDAPLAGIYGLSGQYADELVRVDFAPTDRRLGLFTQPAFLTGHSSSSTRTSPILRAVYLLRRILCQEVPDPPPGAEGTEPPAPEVEPVTTRDYFTWKTSMAVCSSCHETINPIGFAFEEFDAIGRHRASENGAPIDSAGHVTLGAESLDFQGASELLTAIADSSEARACYAKQWLTFSYGRKDSGNDLRTLAIVHQSLADPSYGVRDLVRQLTQSAAFSSLLRSTE
jgi:hypothetical protein